MQIEVRPTAPDTVRKAIERALRRDLDDRALPPAYRSLWRAVGIAENLRQP
jgi:hypothetical protein